MLLYSILNTELQNELEYNNLIGCEVENKNTYISNNLTRIIIPSGKYAKFTMKNKMIR